MDCSHAVKGWLTSVLLVTIGKLINLAPRTDLKAFKGTTIEDIKIAEDIILWFLGDILEQNEVPNANCGTITIAPLWDAQQPLRNLFLSHYNLIICWRFGNFVLSCYIQANKAYWIEISFWELYTVYWVCKRKLQ